MGFIVGLLVLHALVTGAYAEEKRWSEKAELSFVDAGGNTDVTSLSANNLLKYKITDTLEGAWKLGALYGESDGEKDAESYFTAKKP
ncbi:MAG: hypothetical protein ABUK14_02575 [Desulfobacteria bacterium]